MSEKQVTSSSPRHEPAAPTCTACREPAGTCFPNACKAHLAAEERKRRAREFMQREAGYHVD